MQILAIDVETFSGTDLTKSGVYRYAEDPEFEIMLFAYSLDGGPVEVVDLTDICDGQLPENILNALTDHTIIKVAFNAAFERQTISAHFGIPMPPEQWECSMVLVGMLGLPMSLEAAAKVLKLTNQKDAAGKALIKYFSMPCKPTKANGMRTRNLPEHAPEKWAAFIEYCRQDVVVEQAIREKISFFTMPAQEKKLWCLDQKINDTGIMLDPTFVHQAIAMDNINKELLTAEAIGLTGLANPNSAAQLKDWLTKEMPDSVIEKLRKEDIPVLLAESSGDVTRMLEIRQEMAKTSVKKYAAMLKGICADDRLRGIHQFYGASRTGRWAGRLVQPQNLPQNHLPDLDLARALVRSGDTDAVEMLFGNIPDTLSQLIRTAFVAPEGSRFIVVDYSAIEARIISWLAGERWRMEVFMTHGKIYEASAAQMFHVPIESVTKGSPLRQKGKVSELALGYQGGPNALIQMGALKMGIAEEELPKLVKMWRNSNKAIVRLWDDVNAAAIKAVQEGACVRIQYGISFFMEKGILFIQLPSGRRLSYVRPVLKPNRFGGEGLTYEGMDQTTKQWGVTETYGGKLVENLVQSIARDCLAYGMTKVDEAGYTICLHVHDELVAQMPDDEGSLEEIIEILRAPIPWAKTLPLNADGYETKYYKKD